ncbi:MAG TPA: glycoside hydrolase family 38 C-terminal domain-containing protein [bacterium]|nr:glycoside hydrolase family 38 C-terminal domain-containing protein [bacterium]
MKNTLFIVISALLISTFTAAPEALAGEKLDTVVQTLSAQKDNYEYTVKNWKSRNKCDERCANPDMQKIKWKNAGIGQTWVGEGNKIWLKTIIEIPEKVAGIDIAGSKVVFHAHMEGNGIIWVDGVNKNAFRRDQGEALLTKNAKPGEKFTIVMSGESTSSAGIFTNSFLSFSALDERTKRINDFLNKIDTVKLFYEYMKDDEKARWESVMEEAASLVDLGALEPRNDKKLFESLEKASLKLNDFKSIAKQYTMYLLGYSHIDLAWLWDYREGENVWRDTARTVFSLYEEYPDFIFTETQSHGYKWMEDDYPEIYKDLHKYYDQGRWEITGGTWSEHDSNLPSGEGFVRQFLYGKLYFRDKFNKDVIVAWTPDSFGYNWNLPQIIKKSGMIGFLTQKINWNDTTRFPYHIFWWEGPDGTRLLTYFPVGGYGESVEAKRMIDQLKKVKKTHGINENFVIFGVGDHGGGVTRQHLDRAFALKDNDIYPEIKFTSAENYFNHLLDLSKKHEFPTWNDELYLEYHRGTYTTQAKTKRNNRWGQIQMLIAEQFATIANSMGMVYPQQKLFDGWYWILLNHMHDILPGSGINSVYKDTDRDYAKQQRLAKEIISESFDTIGSRINTSGDGQAVVIYNTLAWSRDGIVKISLEKLPENPAVINPSGKIIPSQIIELSNDKQQLIFIARDIPSLGYATYRVVSKPGAAAPQTNLSCNGTTLENSFLKVELDPKSGDIKSIFDKVNNNEIIKSQQGGNILQLYEDKPKNYDAWNIGIGAEKYLDRLGDVELVEAGPVRYTLKSEKRVGDGVSTFDRYITLYNDWPMVDGSIRVNWQERNVIAKLAFNLNMMNETAWFEIPYAAIERPAIQKTPAEQAKWEVSAQKWVDYTDRSGKFGVSLLNSSKYGYDVKNNVLRMTLLRSPTAPDPLADRGKHYIPYALYPHSGDWRDADTPRKGYEFNYPLFSILTENHGGELPTSKSFYSCEPSNVILSVVKKAEKSEDLVIRVVELEGKDATAEITLPVTPKSVHEINLIEDDIENGSDVKIEGNRIIVDVKHFEIKTLKVSL